MKNLPTFAERPDTHQDLYFEELLQTAEYLAMDMETQAMYEKRLKEMRDIQNVENYFRRVTLAEGETLGEASMLKKVKLAVALLKEGISIDDICAKTGLTSEDIADLH